MKNHYQNSYRPQKGLSLIGVIVGIAIGSAFLLAVDRFFLTSIKSQSVTEAQIRLAEQGRFMMNDLRRVITAAGLGIGDTDANDATDEGNPFYDGIVVSPTTSDISDMVAVGYLRTGGCRTQISNVDTNTVSNVVITLDEANRRLQCAESAPTGVVGDLLDAVTIAEDVYAFRVLYGVDRDGDSAPDQYVDDANVSATDIQEQRIKSVRVGVLLGSDSALLARSDAASSRDFNVLGETITITDSTAPGADRKLFNVYETTIMLRNLSGKVSRFDNE